MGTLEIVLLAAGAVIFIASFCIPLKQEKLKEEARNLAAEEIKNLVVGELNAVHGKLAELSEEEMKQQIAKSERTMERISNEKIMAVNEYSDTVLEEIHKNHEEVVFLYDMLKSKNTSLTASYEKADKDLQELLQQVKDSELTVRENLGELEKRKQAVEIPVLRMEKEESVRKQVRETEETKAFMPFVPEKVEVQPKESQVEETEEIPQEKDPSLLLTDMPEKGTAENSNERILTLHKMGKSNMAIARELGLGLGEVKLVIDLYEEIH